MKEFSERLSSLTPEQKALFDSRLKKRGLTPPKKQSSRAPTIPRRKRENHCVLSFDQERLWIIDQMEPGNPAYNIYSASRLIGPLNPAVMERAVNELIKRHEILRTTFSLVEGEPVMVIHPACELKLAFLDISSAPCEGRLQEAIARVNRETNLPFDLERGPLVRAGLIKLDEGDHVIYFTLHHAITDRWSGALIEQEMVAHCLAIIEVRPAPLPAVEIQFADFAEWQRNWLQGEVLEAEMSYWRMQLEGAPLVLDLPTDRPRPPFQTFRGSRELISIPLEILQPLKAMTQREGATMFMCLLAAYNSLLSRYTGQEDILIGLALANRHRPETENMLGYLLSMVAIRSRFSAAFGFRQLLGIVRAASVGAFAHVDFPLGALIQELKASPDPSRNPLFQVAYIYLDFPLETGIEFLNIKAEPLDIDNGAARFDVTLALTELPDRLEALFEYNTDLFDAETIRRMLDHLNRMLEGIVADPDIPLRDIPILSARERRQLLHDWNDTTAPYPKDRCVHELFQEQVERGPDAIAVVFGQSQLSYRKLNEGANALANNLRTRGVGTEVTVGIFLDRSPDTVIAFLATLKAGGAYVPLDPSYPLDRLAFMLDDASISILIVHERLLDELPANFAHIIYMDDHRGAAKHSGGENLSHGAPAGSTAYIIYTSGSTGNPKGVCIPHDAITRLVINTDFVALNCTDRVAQCSNSSFDAITFEMWGALLNGAALVIVDKEKTLSHAELSQVIRQQGITAMFLTTALFKEIAFGLPSAFVPLKHLLFGGEQVDSNRVRDAARQGKPERLLHVYGPTENTTFSSWFIVQAPDDESAVPIGLPISNTVIHLLDRELNLSPVGLAAELFIGGAGLASRYLNRRRITAERFVPNPFALAPGERLYRSGDIVRRRPDGQIVFLGRNDDQIKVRGFRVELREVESAIKRHPDLLDATVAALPDSSNDRHLVAYVVAKTGARITVDDLRHFVGHSLPDYMVPSMMVVIDGMPLTPNGKIDRARLPKPDQLRPDLRAEYSPPTTQTEQALSEIWASLLGLDRVGTQDDFFDLGGNSLVATQVVSRIRHAFKIELSVRALFENPTVNELAATVEEVFLARIETLSEQEAERMLQDISF
jgi:amino acid adenylation domain-containing protein